MPSHKIPDSLEPAINLSAGVILDRIKSTAETGVADVKLAQSDNRFSKIELHRKFSFSLACIILFLLVRRWVPLSAKVEWACRL